MTIIVLEALFRRFSGEWVRPDRRIQIVKAGACGSLDDSVYPVNDIDYDIIVHGAAIPLHQNFKIMEYRIEILDALITAIEHPQKLVNIMMDADEENSEETMSKVKEAYNFTDKQAKAVLEMKVGDIVNGSSEPYRAKLEDMKNQLKYEE
ncbi:MAG: hypothetical protein MJY89_07210 [Bacteroidales bacterium]|nr:hypothetical protein [Bacteroidales bacterium]